MDTSLKQLVRITTPLPSTEWQDARLQDYIEDLTFSTDLTAKSYSSRLISHFVTDKQITFIDNWEVENYRRKIAKNG